MHLITELTANDGRFVAVIQRRDRRGTVTTEYVAESITDLAQRILGGWPDDDREKATASVRLRNSLPNPNDDGLLFDLRRELDKACYEWLDKK